MIDRFWYAKRFTAPEQTFVCSGNDSWNLLNCASSRYDYCQDRLIFNTPFKTCYIKPKIEQNYPEEMSRRIFRRLVSYLSSLIFFYVQYVMPKENNLRELFWPYVLKINARQIEAAQTNWFKLVPFTLFSLLQRYKPAKNKKLTIINK